MTYAPNSDGFHDYVDLLTGGITPEGIASICWAAFPEARSRTHLSEIVAAYLAVKNVSVRPRTVRRWFSGDSDPRGKSMRELQRLMATEKVMLKLKPKRPYTQKGGAA